ncbi:Aldo/keto reductase [Trichodelitschia bisporula]|uniref:Aldo/keto reductase n=1 Tax=Trichodelitschia bisporula TaxID=703511 RepID=A0A6G1HLI6_9PEZI|nr:Aldo/keto reductase [Trichodelitschia bisporula]
MEKLLTATPRRTRFIGISNFSPKQLKETMTAASVTPYMHQFEMHPYLQQTDFIAANKAYNISLTGYAPLGNTNAPYRASSLYSPSEPPPLLQNSVITEIATARNCTPAQVVLAWNLARGVTVIPKAAQPGHQAENLATWTRCTLGEGDAEKVAKMQDRWVRRVNNPCLQMRMPCFEGLAGGPPAT